MGFYKCHHCGWENETEFSDEEMTANSPVERICFRCGSVSTVTPGAAEARLACLPPKGFEWLKPLGRIGDPLSGFIYTTALGEEMLSDGTRLTRDVWIKTFKIDPLRALIYMRTGEVVKGELTEEDYDKYAKKPFHIGGTPPKK